MFSLKNYLTDYKWQVELSYKDFAAIKQFTFGKFDPIMGLIETLAVEVEKLRNDQDLKKESINRLVEEQVKIVTDQITVLKNDCLKEYEQVQRIIRDKLYAPNQQSELMQLLSFMKESEIRQHIGKDLMKFVAENSAALDDLNILSAIMHDPTKALSSQAKEMGKGGTLDIEEMHLRNNNPEQYEALKTAERNAVSAKAVFTHAQNFADGMRSDSPAPVNISSELELSE
jgi:hypothetical protein